MKCRYDRDTETYRLPDGEPCLVDEHGDPTHHCQHRRSCTVHVGPNERTCPRCTGRTRLDIRTIVQLSALLPAQALYTGVTGDALAYAGPAADPRGHLERKLSAGRRDTYAYFAGDINGDEYVKRMFAADADPGLHPANVLGEWTLMLAEHYDHTLPTDRRLTLSWCADYLTRHLTRASNDPDLDFKQMAQEIKQTRTRIELTLRAHRQTEQGAPCPSCIAERGTGPRLVRRYGHWCDDLSCEKMHYHDETGDEWVCPRNGDHRWSDEDYRLRVADVYTEHAARKPRTPKPSD